MADGFVLRSLLVAFFFAVCGVSTAQAAGLDTGDALALILGIVITIFGTCACLGIYARKRNARGAAAASLLTQDVATIRFEKHRRRPLVTADALNDCSLQHLRAMTARQHSARIRTHRCGITKCFLCPRLSSTEV
ncbi:hypothetical protein HPB50_004664 [Hyalomma asiaticum]|uniref:Uncharacterized protein n=1 Tax=Hyalomma asiaticum TaxID=266040 RepID=A0ACB7RHN8_HYAAI|nr:hypothetical protein HPB50_004664 [Hyalomma asiaticum]